MWRAPKSCTSSCLPDCQGLDPLQLPSTFTGPRGHRLGTVCTRNEGDVWFFQSYILILGSKSLVWLGTGQNTSRSNFTQAPSGVFPSEHRQLPMLSLHRLTPPFPMALSRWGTDFLHPALHLLVPHMAKVRHKIFFSEKIKTQVLCGFMSTLGRSSTLQLCTLVSIAAEPGEFPFPVLL